VIIGKSILKCARFHFTPLLHHTHHALCPLPRPTPKLTAKNNPRQTSYIFMPSDNMPSIKTIVQLSIGKTSYNPTYPSLSLYIAQIATIGNSIVLLCLPYDAAHHVAHADNPALKDTATNLARIADHPRYTADMIMRFYKRSFDLHISYTPVQHQPKKSLIITFHPSVNIRPIYRMSLPLKRATKRSVFLPIWYPLYMTNRRVFLPLRAACSVIEESIVRQAQLLLMEIDSRVDQFGETP